MNEQLDEEIHKVRSRRTTPPPPYTQEFLSTWSLEYITFLAHDILSGLPTWKFSEHVPLGFYGDFTFCCLVIHSCPGLCDPMDCSPPGSSVRDSPGKNTGVGCCFLLQRIFLTQGSNVFPASPALQADSLLLHRQGRLHYIVVID